MTGETIGLHPEAVNLRRQRPGECAGALWVALWALARTAAGADHPAVKSGARQAPRAPGVHELPTAGRAAGAAEGSRVRSVSMSGARRKRRLPGAFGFLARGRPDNLPANHVSSSATAADNLNWRRPLG